MSQCLMSLKKKNLVFICLMKCHLVYIEFYFVILQSSIPSALRSMRNMFIGKFISYSKNNIHMPKYLLLEIFSLH